MKLKLFALAGALAVMVFTGCQTPAKTGPLASVVITNQPMSAITQTVDAVFVNHGYSGGQTGPGEFAFNRLGTLSDNVAYSTGPFSSIETIRVVVLATQIDAGSTLVGCDVWLTQGSDGSPFGRGREIRDVRPEPYQKILRDIQAQFGQ